MTETMELPSVQAPILRPNQFEISVPRNEKGERIGTGAIVEPLRPGLPGETVRGAILKAILRAGRTMQAPRGVVAQTETHTGKSFVTAQERARAAARTEQRQQPPVADQRESADTIQLAQADKQQAKEALETTRSALKNTLAAQAESEKPQPHDQDKGVKEPAGAKTKEQETEPVKFYSTKDGHELFTLQLPKGRKYTTADVNRALKAAGNDFTYTPAWTPDGWGMRGRDIFQALKKAFQAAAPTEAQQPGQKAA